MNLTIKEIELVYLGASIVSGCKSCLSYHFRKVKEAGATEEEIRNAITVSINIHDAAKSEMKNHALNLSGQSAQDDINKYNLILDRTSILISVGAAFAANCTFTLNKYIVLGKSAGITNNVLIRVFKAAKLVKMKAASHVDNIAIRFEEANLDDRNSYKSDDCGCKKSESDLQIKSNDFEVNNCC